MPESLIEPTSQYIILKYHSNIISSAGTGTLNYQLQHEPIIVDISILEYINSNYKYTEIIKSQGDSMLPLIQENSLIFVDTLDKNINSKNIYVVNVKGELFIKKIVFKDGLYLLRSLNQSYRDIKVKDFNVIGKVKGVLNRV